MFQILCEVHGGRGESQWGHKHTEMETKLRAEPRQKTEERSRKEGGSRDKLWPV